jgi:hypothetical protein
MKAWKTLIVACAVLAIAAPVANATFDRSLPVSAPNAKIAKKSHHKKVSPKIKSTTPRVLIIVAQGPTPGVADWSGDCATSANNCTNQQLCDMWAVNCDLATADQANSAATDDQSTTS